MSGIPHVSGSASASAMPSMSGMNPGNGLSAASHGYRMNAGAATLPAGKPADYRFTITGPNGRPVTDYALDQTKRLHFYLIRSDLTGFQHLHPTMSADGTWTAHLNALRPGSWQFFADFTPNSGPSKGTGLVLSRTATVSGRVATAALPPPAPTTTLDHFTVTVTGEPVAGMARPLTVTITKGGKPVTDLQPYLDTYAHLTAFHADDMAFAHLHPETTVSGTRGGPTLTFHTEFDKPGYWRLFLQFQTSGKLHTAAVTVHVSH